MIDLRLIEQNILRDEVFETACHHGWHTQDMSNEHWLMMIITEMAEAIQADRHDLHAEKAAFLKDTTQALNRIQNPDTFSEYCQDSFDAHIKNSFEDELADIVIRCYDFLGLKKLDIDSWFHEHNVYKDLEDLVKAYMRLPVTDFMYLLTKHFGDSSDNRHTCNQVCIVIWLVFQYADEREIDLIWFITHKMIYNEKRPYKHKCRY